MIKTEGKIEGDIEIALLGFDNLTITPQLITFNEYLVSLENKKFEFPQQIKIKATLSPKARLRALQETEKEVLCFIQNEVNKTFSKYSGNLASNSTFFPLLG